MPRKGRTNPTKKSLKYTSNRYKTPEQKELSIQFKKNKENRNPRETREIEILKSVDAITGNPKNKSYPLIPGSVLIPPNLEPAYSELGHTNDAKLTAYSIGDKWRSSEGYKPEYPYHILEFDNTTGEPTDLNKVNYSRIFKNED